MSETDDSKTVTHVYHLCSVVFRRCLEMRCIFYRMLKIPFYTNWKDRMMDSELFCINLEEYHSADDNYLASVVETIHEGLCVCVGERQRPLESNRDHKAASKSEWEGGGAITGDILIHWALKQSSDPSQP